MGNEIRVRCFLTEKLVKKSPRVIAVQQAWTTSSGWDKSLESSEEEVSKKKNPYIIWYIWVESDGNLRALMVQKKK